MEKKIVIVIGSGHLAHRLKKYLNTEGYTVINTNIELINAESDSISLIENLAEYINKIELTDIAMIYLLEDKDENNLQLIISLISLIINVPITAALFNENLIPHLQQEHINLKILNPAKIAAPAFVEQLYLEINSEALFPNKLSDIDRHSKKLTLIHKLLLSFITLLLAAVCFFHFYENLAWIDAFYFVIVTAASVGYGDINLAKSAVLSKVIVMLLITVSTIAIWMIFSLTIDGFLRRRIQHELGRKKYVLQNHVIVCGLGRLGYFIALELLHRKEKIIIIEQNENSNHIDYFRQLGAEVYLGDARLPKVIRDVNVGQAKALISVINNDSLNLEIGLNARSHQPNVKLILRIFDDQMAERIKDYLQIYHSVSASAIANDVFYHELTKSSKAAH